MEDRDMDEQRGEEEAVRAAVVKFYDAIEHLIRGHGTSAMKEAWHHTPRVTAAHPMGDWSHGWDEILASWEVVAALGSEDSAGTSIRDLRVHLYGDVAYSTCVFVASPRFGGATVNCTNVLYRDGGAWKLVHHHADRSQKIENALETIAETGSLPP
jgi:ketosteroid isomerase-like protein